MISGNTNILKFANHIEYRHGNSNRFLKLGKNCLPGHAQTNLYIHIGNILEHEGLVLINYVKKWLPILTWYIVPSK